MALDLLSRTHGGYRLYLTVSWYKLLMMKMIVPVSILTFQYYQCENNFRFFFQLSLKKWCGVGVRSASTARCHAARNLPPLSAVLSQHADLPGTRFPLN